MLINREVGEIS